MTESQELAVREAEELALAQAQEAEFEGDDNLSVPILKIGQPLTKEVQEEEAEVGEFINTLTGEAITGPVEFIVAYYNRGRFASDKESGRAYVAFGDTIPDAWSELVGEEFVGTPFAEYPDAEEKYKERVNNDEIEWGSGPLVSTTHNYTGLLVVQPYEEDGEVERKPVRLSLQRTNMPAVRKFNTIKRMVLRNKPFWDVAFELSSYGKPFKKGKAYLLNVKSGRKTTADEREDAKNLALAVVGGRVQANDSQAEDPEPTAPAQEPEAAGGLSV